MTFRLMTDAEREEIAAIEKRCAERSDAACRKLFGVPVNRSVPGIRKQYPFLGIDG